MVTILLFAHLKEELRTDRLQLELEGTLTVGGLKEELAARYPGIRFDGVMVAVNEELASPDDEIVPGDTVALIPPVSGG